MKNIYGFRNLESRKFMFSYRTNQGNHKKAFFASRTNAEKALKRYIPNASVWIVDCIDEMYEEG